MCGGGGEGCAEFSQAFALYDGAGLDACFFERVFKCVMFVCGWNSSTITLLLEDLMFQCIVFYRCYDLVLFGPGHWGST